MEGSADASKVYDVVVVGAGIMGSCAAYYLSRRCRAVLLLEQFDLLHHLGSSHGESRTIRATYPESYYPPMALESFLLWREAEAEAGYRVLVPTPHFDIGPAANRSLLLAAQNCRSSSVPFRFVSPAEAAKMFSGSFALPPDWIGLLSDFGGVIKPTKAVAMFQTLAIRRGATVKDRVEVVSIQKESGKGDGAIRVSTKGGNQFLGKKCVVTAGAWTRKLVEAVSGHSIPIQPYHTTVCYWQIRQGHEADFTPEAGFPTFASYGDPFVYGTPSLEFPGLIKIALHAGYPCDPNARNWVTDTELLGRRLMPWIEKIMPGLVDAGRPVAVQSCMYSITPDGDFVIDFLGGEFGKDVVVAGGFSGHGFKMGPAVGRIVADMVMQGRAEGMELEKFRLKRFEGNPKGNVKDFEEPVHSYGPPPSRSTL